MNVKGLLLDIDGVLFIGNAPIKGAIEAINQLRELSLPMRFLTNNTTLSNASLHKKLIDMGLPIEPDECFGVIKAAQLYLRSLNRPKCYFLLTEDPLKDFAEFETVDKNPDLILIGDVGKAWDYDLMQRLFEMIMAGARLVSLHKGKFWQMEDGLRMDLGAFIAGLEYVTSTEAQIIGKPEAAMFEIALADLGLASSEVAMIGDDINNDIRGSQAVGMRGILVRTGKYRQELFDRSTIQPDLVIDSIADLPKLISSQQ